MAAQLGQQQQHSRYRDSLVFRIDPKLLQHRPPRLTLAATLDTLGKRVDSGELDANLIVDILDENRLLPYIIGDTKNLYSVSLGQMTNASKIGDIIISEECIRGTYELCLAFLNFVLTILRAPSYVDTSRTMLASVTYITNEVYPNHHIWTYRNISDQSSILHKCTEIFNQIVVNNKLSTKRESSELEIVTVINLCQNQAHKQLLNVVIEGKQSIKKVTGDANFNGEQSLREAPIVICTRQSLAIFERLLITYEPLENILKSQMQTSSSQDSATSNTMTNIERALFDTSIRPGLLQQLFSYIYQREDIVTACLAFHLIKRIAEKFTMSLMASLGSEADRVCEFFIEYLDHKDANIDLQIAILDLLSTCVKHQPGLIELFLNSEHPKSSNLNKDKSTEVNTPKEGQTKSELKSLDVVMNLLRECRNEQSDGHKKLYTYVMKFILTFWQKCHSAIEQFDKADQFWDSITDTLVKFIEVQPTITETYTPSDILCDKLNSYSLMILAREIFNVHAGINERKMNSKLKGKLEELGKKGFMANYSTYITRRYEHLASNIDKNDDYNRLLSAWRDFLASSSKYKPFEIDDQVKKQIVENTLKCLTIELRLGEKLNKERMAAIGETLLLIWSKWMTKNSAGDDVFRYIHELIYLADSNKDYLPFSFLVTFQATLSLYLMRNMEYLIDSKRSFDLLVPALQMMQFSLKIMEKSINRRPTTPGIMGFDFSDRKPSVESRLCQFSITTLRFIIDSSKSYVDQWIPYLLADLKTDSLVQFLTILMNKRTDSEVCLSMVELLLSLSCIRQTADYMHKSGLINQVNMISMSAYERPYVHLSQLANTINPIGSKQQQATITDDNNRLASGIGQGVGLGAGLASGLGNKSTATGIGLNHQHHSYQHQINIMDSTSANLDGTINTTSNANKAPISDTEKTFLDNMNSSSEWLPIYQHVIQLNISMILTLGNDYVGTAIEFLSTHCIRICELVELLRTKPRSVNMEEALQLIYLINLVLRHSFMWIKKNRQTYSAITDEITKTAYTLATSALPPPVLPDVLHFLLKANQTIGGQQSRTCNV